MTQAAPEFGKKIEQTRRQYLKAAGAVGAGVAGLAGATSSAAQGQKYEGVTVRFWDVLNVQSKAAKEAITGIIEQFEQDTGADIKVNYSGYQQLLGPKWVNTFERGDQPHIYTSETEWSGRFVAGGWVKPTDRLKEEYSDLWSEELESAAEWVMPAQRYNARGYEGDHVWEHPIGCLPRTPFVARMDHFEQAGLSPEEDFPPKNYDHAIEVATQLQEQGPAQFGFHIYGVKWDWFDIAHPWAIAKGGQDGAFLNDDWSEVNYERDIWKTTMQQYQDVYQKHELSGPKSPTAGDEEMVPMLISGQTSMSMPEWLNHPTFLRRAPDLMENGNLRYGATWKGESGMRGPIGLWTIGITQKPDGVSEQNWNESQEAAVDFMANYLLSKEFQQDLQQTLGLLPIRDDVWEAAQQNSKWESGHKMVQTGIEMIPDTKEIGWEYHPNMPDIMFNRIAPKVERMLQGEMEPAAVCTQAANEIREQNLLDYPTNPLNE